MTPDGRFAKGAYWSLARIRARSFRNSFRMALTSSSGELNCFSLVCLCTSSCRNSSFTRAATFSAAGKNVGCFWSAIS